jgi:hypothetical protein
MPQPKLVAVSLALAVLAPAVPALAQAPEQSASDNYLYKFDDDYMVGDTLDTTPALLRLRPGPMRVTLIRPRASFVAEMLKSVEIM